MVGITKAFSDSFGRGGIADRMIWFNGFPFLDTKEDPTFGVPVAEAMVRNIVSIPSSGLTLGDIETLLETYSFRGFPIVEDKVNSLLVGYIGRSELAHAAKRAKLGSGITSTTRCCFSTPDTPAPIESEGMTEDPWSPIIPMSPAYPPALAASSGPNSIDFAHYIDPCPLSVMPKLALETTMDLFKALGPHTILVEYRGRLVGMITVKDILKFEAMHHAEGLHEVRRKRKKEVNEFDEWTWEHLTSVITWLKERGEQLLQRLMTSVARRRT